MRVVQAVWSSGRLHLWGECILVRCPLDSGISESSGAGDSYATNSDDGRDARSTNQGALRDPAGEEARSTLESAAPLHPYSLDPTTILSMLAVDSAASHRLTLRLPTIGAAPIPSPHLAHAAGLPAHDPNAILSSWIVPTVAIPPVAVLSTLEALEERMAPMTDESPAPRSRPLFLPERAGERDDSHAHGSGEPCHPGTHGNGSPFLADSTRYAALAARVARRLLVEQRFIPNVLEDRTGAISGVWRPWLCDESLRDMVTDLLASMPPAFRAAVDPFAHDAWPMLLDYLGALCDAMCRARLVAENFADAIEGRDSQQDPHVAWLSGLLRAEGDIHVNGAMSSRVVRGVREWFSRLDERGADSGWTLCFHLIEPLSESTPQFGAPGRDARWTLRFELQSVEHPETRIDASELWEAPADATTVGGLHLESPHDLLLAELARAARLYPAVERAIEQDEAPSSLQLTTTQAYDFLREYRPLLLEQGFAANVPEWWESPLSRLGVSLELHGDERSGASGDPDGAASDHASLGLDALVDYQWRLSLGELPLTAEQFQELTELNMPLVRVSGRWIELRPADVKSARAFLTAHPGGTTTLGLALRLAFGVDAEEAGLHVQGLSAEGWANRLFAQDGGAVQMESMAQPNGLTGQLRPYQLSGLSWLTFLDRLGLGACLADDMGLGKTVQLLALVLSEQERAKARADDRPIAPTLIVAPLSVISNWQREAHRFTPALRTMVHHGPERLTGEAFERKVRETHMVITTYALAHRDVESIGRVLWRRVVLDEAQCIKNPSAKQTQAILRLSTNRRIALTGTPVENRLSELWSIMNFCNEGYLGTLGEFRRRFALPIERRHHKGRANQLRSLTRPFILRRLKTDPAIAADLPAKIENKVYSHLTPEQAALYERAVAGMLTEVDQADGMRRRGIVLATLIRLKQICNHPAQALREHFSSESAFDPRRSGKCQRLIEMLDEVVAEGQQALVFTQFRRMGDLLAVMLRRRLDREVLFLNGSTPERERRRMIDQFQSAGATSPIFLLSLKAGGFGLNLTAASHVFHFDRWWNPAVENQATDRAHRIGQTRSVHVHKFIVAGTLEERIDRMIEEKSNLADRIIGSGERGLTELSTAGLRELLMLRSDAIGDDDSDDMFDGLDDAPALASSLGPGVPAVTPPSPASQPGEVSRQTDANSLAQIHSTESGNATSETPMPTDRSAAQASIAGESLRGDAP